MKNIFFAILFLATLILAPSILNWRAQDGKVLNKHMIETEDGNIWEYDTEIPKGTKVQVWFNNNDTPKIEDDIIWNVQAK